MFYQVPSISWASSAITADTNASYKLLTHVTDFGKCLPQNVSNSRWLTVSKKSNGAEDLLPTFVNEANNYGRFTLYLACISAFKFKFVTV